MKFGIRVAFFHHQLHKLEEHSVGTFMKEALHHCGNSFNYNKEERMKETIREEWKNRRKKSSRENGSDEKKIQKKRKIEGKEKEAEAFSSLVQSFSKASASLPAEAGCVQHVYVIFLYLTRCSIQQLNVVQSLMRYNYPSQLTGIMWPSRSNHAARALHWPFLSTLSAVSVPFHSNRRTGARKRLRRISEEPLDELHWTQMHRHRHHARQNSSIRAVGS